MTSAILHKRRVSPNEGHDETNIVPQKEILDPEKLQKELTVGLVVGQWIVPPVLFLLLPGMPSISRRPWPRFNYEETWILALLCNALLIMALGYLVQHRVEHWHIRPTIFWVIVPPLYALASQEPHICLVALVVITIPFCVVFATWCARYGVHNTFEMSQKHLEGIFSQRLVILTKQHGYDLDKLYHSRNNKNNEQEDDAETANTKEEPMLIPEPEPEELERIRANTAKHLRPHLCILVLFLVFSLWSTHQSTQMMVPLFNANAELLNRHHHSVRWTGHLHNHPSDFHSVRTSSNSRAAALGEECDPVAYGTGQKSNCPIVPCVRPPSGCHYISGPHVVTQHGCCPIITNMCYAVDPNGN